MTTLAWGDQDPRIRRAVQQVLDQLVLGKGLRRDKNGKIELAVSGRSPFYFEGDELQLRAADGLVVSPGSPTALRVESIDSDKVRETSASSTSVSSSIRRLTNAIATINATLATLGTSTGANVVDVSVDFGSSFTQYATATVTGETWVTASSVIAATVKADAGKAMETSLFDFHPVVSDLVAGDGFTLTVFTLVKAKGTYTFSCVGV